MENKISTFLNSKIVKTDVGEETYLTWKETISYALGYLLMLIPMHFYNITGDSHRKMMKEIAQRNNTQIEKDSTQTVNE